MLRLLSAPAWAPEGEEPRPLPMTLPSALLIVLSAQVGWMSREQLSLVFWPDALPGVARHNLRIALFRLRQMLAEWGLGEALQAERVRIRIDLPSDLRLLLEARARLSAVHTLNPADWLRGWQIGGYEGFIHWSDEFAQRLQAEWLAVARRGEAAHTPVQAVDLVAAPPARAAELHRLVASAAPAVLLVGEPGAGKTTLLKAAHPQAPCLHGLEGLHGMPYRPILDALRVHLPVLARALRDPAHALRPYRLDLARVLPELAPDEALPPLDALTAQTRLVEALARAFESLTTVVLVDDLQWCDAATVEWLLMLAHSGRLRWRAAARVHEITPDLAAALQPLRALGRLEELPLPPLDRAALGEVCLARWPQQAFTPQQLDRLQAISGGNVFLLGELVAAGVTGDAEGESMAVLDRVAQLVRRRLAGLSPEARQAVDAAAVYVQRVSAAALFMPASGMLSVASADSASGPWRAACDSAVAAGLLNEDASGLACRHDLIRQAVVRELGATRLALLHRHAALWLASRADADAMSIAEHWRLAGEAQTALAWCHRAAEQLKSRGRFEQAKTLWHEVADESLDAAQALRARLELAACDLFEDLQRGEASLEAVRAQLDAVADPERHRQIEGRALSALVDNRVFAGDIARARVHAVRLRELLPGLAHAEQVDAIEVLIELAMREPDIPAAWQLLAQLRSVAPRRPTVLSFEGQIHWFGGQVQAAHDALARLLERHPDYCRGITIENDLAVMLQALGRLDEAESMARRSLHSWAGVAHTETLSLLVLGLVLTSAGRYAEAEAALLRAQAMAREQASPGFEAEALVRHARLLLQCGRIDAARQALERAAPLLAASPEPLRVSQLVLVQVLLATASDSDVDETSLQRLQDAAGRSAHPLVHVRLARVQAELALAGGDAAGAQAAAGQQAAAAERGGLQEPLVEAWLLQARAAQLAGQPPAAVVPLVERAAQRAEALGLSDLCWRAHAWLAAHGVAASSARAEAALALLQGDVDLTRFNAAAAARREPAAG